MRAPRRQRHLLAWAAAILAVALTTLAPVANAGPPQPAKGRGDKCVADTDWMRRNHMSVLTHQRDETVHEGLRDTKFSLKGCIDCHQVKDTSGKAVTVADPKHFCRTCHDYAAVRVDCFECHASRLGEEQRTGAAGPIGGGAVDPHHGTMAAAMSEAQAREQASLRQYLKEVGR